MAESNEDTKVQQHGRKRSYKLLFRRGKGMPTVGFSQTIIDSALIGVTYTVQSTLNPVTFRKLKEAKQFQALLKLSIKPVHSVIVRQEYTEEGFEVS